MRSSAGPTGQPARHVEGSSAAVTGPTVPVKGATVVEGGGADVVGTGAVLEGVLRRGALLVLGAVRWALDVATRPVLHPAAKASAPTAGRRRVRARTARHATGRQGPSRARPPAAVAAGVVAAALLTVTAGCASAPSAGPGRAVRHALTATTAPTTTQPPTTTTTAPPTTVPPPVTAPPTTAPEPHAAVSDVAGQEVVVSASGYGLSTATLTAYQRTTAGWRVAFGPFPAHVGYNGFAAPGAKREGDGRTPSGAYGFGFAFGVQPDPGLALPFRRVTGPSIVWDDDPSSARYNQWVDESTGADPGADPEPMDNSPAYDYGALVDYNTAPVVAGAGSAIFLHVSTGGSTAGCVSVAVSELLDVLRWLSPSQQPTIVMGVGAPAP